MKRPKLRTVEKYEPPFPLNEFPSDFSLNLGREITYLLVTRQTPRLEGTDWEEIFARCIYGRWKPSNVGLDDVLLEQTAWSAKTVKAKSPAQAKKVRLISGRNSPSFSFDSDVSRNQDPNEVGKMVISIWNERVAAIRAKYQHLRTVVLIKSYDLLELAAFEHDTDLVEADSVEWSWNKNNNLVGHSKATKEHRYTWQPHGSQFTIVEQVPDNRLAIGLRLPPPLDRDSALETIGFDPSWITLL